MKSDARRISSRTMVLDHAGQCIGYCGPDETRRLISSGTVSALGSKHKIRCIRFWGPDPAELTSGSHHRRPIGTPHKNENYYNPRGVWHLDRIPDIYRSYFRLSYTYG